MSEPMTSQYAFSFPDPSSFSTQQATFTSFSPEQTLKPVTNSQPNLQTSNNFQNQLFQQYHTATLSSNNAKFPYLKKDEYETWAMKMEYWITNTDHNLWKIIQNGNSKKSLGRDSKGGIIILPPISFEEYARFGGNEESKKMRKTMLKQEFLEFSVSEEKGLHKGYDRVLPPSWSQVSLTLKTRGGLEYLSFDDLYNKLRSFEIDVKGGSSYGSRSTTVAPTHFAFIGAASTNTKMVYSDQPSYSSSITYTSVPSGIIIEDVLNSFVDENKPTQQLAYEDFKQINFNNKDSARFDRRKARCYNCLQFGHFSRECNVKKVDEKARYFAFKVSEVKIEKPKAMVSVDSMLNWNEHEAENKTKEGEEVYGLMAGFMSGFADHAGNAAGSVYNVAAEFAMMGISLKVQTCPFGFKTLELQKDWYHKTQLPLEEKVRILSANLENTTNTLKYSKTLYDRAKIKEKEWEVKFVESLARFNKWKESSQNLAKLKYSSMSTRTKLGLGFKEYIGSDEVCDLSTPSVFDPEPENRE
nr:hypothetical protein [Tanacetum cinerariifolium]